MECITKQLKRMEKPYVLFKVSLKSEQTKVYTSNTLSSCYDLIKEIDENFMSYQTFLLKIKKKREFNEMFEHGEKCIFYHAVSGDLFVKDKAVSFYIHESQKI